MKNIVIFCCLLCSVSALAQTTTTADNIIARKKLRVAMDTSKYWTSIMHTISNAATHRQGTTAKAVYDYCTRFVEVIGAPTTGQTIKWDGTKWVPADDLSGISTTARFTGNGVVGTPLELAQQGATVGQVLKWNGTAWLPAIDSVGAGGGVINTTSIPDYFPFSSGAIGRIKDGLDSFNIVGIGTSQVQFPTGWAYNLVSTGFKALEPSGAGFISAGYPENFIHETVTRWDAANWTIRSRTTTPKGRGLNMFSAVSAPGSTTAIFRTTSATTNDKRFNRLEVWYVGQASGGEFSITVDGGAATTVNTALTTGFQCKHIPIATDTAHTINITPISANAEIIGLVFARTANGFRFYNGGHANSISTQWVGIDSSVWKAQLAHINPKVLFFDIGVNDRRTNVDSSTFLNNLNTIVGYARRALPKTDITIVGLYPYDESLWGAGLYPNSAYNRQGETIAKRYNAAFIDGEKLFGSYSLMVQRKHISADGLHLDTLGGGLLVNTLIGKISGFPFGATKATMDDTYRNFAPQTVRTVNVNSGNLVYSLTGTNSIINRLNGSGEYRIDGPTFYNTFATNGYVGFGTRTPERKLTIVDGVGSYLRVRGDNNVGIELYNNNNSPNAAWDSYTSRGTFSAPTNIIKGTSINQFRFFGYYNGAYSSLASIQSVVSEDPATAGGANADLIFSTKHPALGTPFERLRIKGRGQIGINESTPYSWVSIKSVFGNNLSILGLRNASGDSSHIWMNSAVTPNGSAVGLANDLMISTGAGNVGFWQKLSGTGNTGWGELFNMSKSYGASSNTVLTYNGTTWAAAAAANIYSANGTLTAARTVTHNGNTITWNANAAPTPDVHIIRGGGTSTRAFIFQNNLGNPTGHISYRDTMVTLGSYSGINTQIVADAFALELTRAGAVVIPDNTSPPASNKLGALTFNSNSNGLFLQAQTGAAGVERVATVQNDLTPNALNLITGTHTLAGKNWTSRADANAGAFTVTLGVQLAEGVDYLVMCKRNGTNAVTFTAAAGYSLSHALDTALTSGDLVAGGVGGTGLAAPGNTYYIRRSGTIISIK